MCDMTKRDIPAIEKELINHFTALLVQKFNEKRVEIFTKEFSDSTSVDILNKMYKIYHKELEKSFKERATKLAYGALEIFEDMVKD
jgi:hypothetical protein